MLLAWTIVFLIIAGVAALFGFTGLASAAAMIAKVIFFIFVVLFVIALLFYLIRKIFGGNGPENP